jgi:hypothetical protein
MNQITHLNNCIGLLEKLNDLEAELKNEQENFISKTKMFPSIDHSKNHLKILELERDILVTQIAFNKEIRLIEPLN